MLDELISFEEIPKKEITSYQEYLSKKTFIFQPDNHNSNKTTKLVKKVKLVLMKEKLKKKKEKKIYDLHKDKKMNLRQFLTRVEKYEQKRKYNLELMKNKILLEESKTILKKPKICEQSLKICKSMPRLPLYKRSYEEMCKHKEKINNMAKLNTIQTNLMDKYNLNPKELNSKIQLFKQHQHCKSSEMNNDNNNLFSQSDYFQKKMKKNQKKMTLQESDEFFKKQELWLKTKFERNNFIEKNLLTYTNPHLYYLNTSEIFDIKNRIKTSEASKIILDKKNQLHTIQNDGKTVWDKLYENAEQKLDYDEVIALKDLSPIKKRAKFQHISSKFFNIFVNKNSDENFNKKNKQEQLDEQKNEEKNNISTVSKRVNRSIENKNMIHLDKIKRKSISVFNDCKRNFKDEYKYFKNHMKDKKISKHKILLNLKQNLSETNDHTYHLNIMESGAWNDNIVNDIKFNNFPKDRSFIKMLNSTINRLNI